MGNGVSDFVMGEISSRKDMIDSFNRYVTHPHLFHQTHTHTHKHNRGNIQVFRDAIAKVKSGVYLKNGNKGNQAKKMLSYFTSPLQSKRYPECNDMTPLDYARLMNAKKIVTLSMIRELEREIRTCQERIEESEVVPDKVSSSSSSSSTMSDATSSLIQSQIDYVKKQLKEGKITQKQADEKMKRYKMMGAKLNKRY